MHIAALLQCFLIMLGICIGIKRFGKQQLAFRSKTASLDAVRLFSGTKYIDIKVNYLLVINL